MRIFLLGFMGSGKTHFGKLLSEALNCQFIDLDEYVEAKEDMSVAQIFKEKGEKHFRFAERLALRETYDFKKVVIATGGGTPVFYDNMEWINDTGVSVWIKTPHDVLVKRLRLEQEQRPLIAGKTLEELDDFIARKMEERLPFYEQAKIVFTPQLGNSERDVKALLLQLSQMAK